MKVVEIVPSCVDTELYAGHRHPLTRYQPLPTFMEGVESQLAQADRHEVIVGSAEMTYRRVKEYLGGFVHMINEQILTPMTPELIEQILVAQRTGVTVLRGVLPKKQPPQTTSAPPSNPPASSSGAPSETKQ